jgi:peptidase M48-like protein
MSNALADLKPALDVHEQTLWQRCEKEHNGTSVPRNGGRLLSAQLQTHSWHISSPALLGDMMTLWHRNYTRATWLALVGGLLGSRAFAQTSSTGLTIDQEQHLGSIMWQKWKAERGIAETPQSSRVEGYLQSVCDKLAPHVPWKIPFHAHLDADPAFKSAVALPGGIVVVGVGILALVDSEDALAVVIGHEMGHIENGDIDEDLVRIEQTQHIAPTHLADLSVDTVTPDHTNVQELAADRSGLFFAVAAGYSPYAAVRLLELFQYMAHGKTPRPGALTLERRLSQMRQLIAINNWEHLKGSVHPLALPEPG